MDQKQIADKIEAFIRDKFQVADDDPDFDQEVHIFDYGYVDSFGAVELTTHVESEFGIQINDTDLILHPMNTVQEIAAFVLKRQAGEV